MVPRKSVGAVIFRSEGERGERLYLLLHYGAGHWDFVKGGVEPGEEDEQTLERECREETGITALRVVPGFYTDIEYFFKEEGNLVKKTVIFFIAETGQRDVKLSDEHDDFAWLPFSGALEKLTYKNAKTVLEKADAFLNSMPKEPQHKLE